LLGNELQSLIRDSDLQITRLQERLDAAEVRALELQRQLDQRSSESMEFGGAEVGRSTPARLRFGLRSRPPKFYRITDRLLKFVAIGSLVLALTGIATVLVLSVGVSDPPSQTSVVR
jgi:hypothetical protein